MTDSARQPIKITKRAEAVLERIRQVAEERIARGDVGENPPGPVVALVGALAAFQVAREEGDKHDDLRAPQVGQEDFVESLHRLEQEVKDFLA